MFFLYGEPRREIGARFLHLEPLETRSKASNWNIRPHAHAELHHIFYIADGQGQMAAEDKMIAFAAPCLLVIPAGTVHGLSYRPGATGSVLTIAESYLRELAQREPGFAGVFGVAQRLGVEDVKGIEDRLTRLGQELVWSAPGHAAAVEGHLLGILVEALRLTHYAAEGSRPVAGRAAALVARFREQIEVMYRSSAPLRAYAVALRVSPAQLRRACLQIAGSPPITMIQDRVFLEAQRLLLYTNMTVTEAANHLGFQDNAYFSRFFARRAGRSPRAFRCR